MDAYFDTEKYTLVPYEYHSTGKERACLSSLFELENEDVKALNVPSYGAAMLFASPDGIGDAAPASFRVLELLGQIPESHKAMVRFSDGLVTVALADRDHLLLLCSYKVSSFTDALYYLFAALKEVLFEPDHTALYWCGSVSDGDWNVMSRYFERIIETEF